MFSHLSRRSSTIRIIKTTLVASLALGGLYLINTPEASSRSGLKSRFIPQKPLTVTISENAEISHVVVKFTNSSQVRPALTRGGFRFESRAGQDMTPVENILSAELSSGNVARAFELPISKLDSDRARREKISGRELADLNGYYEIAVESPAQAEALINQLNALSVVEIAYPRPKPTPASIQMATPSLSDSQDYLRPAPAGVDADYAQTLSGGDGAGIKVIDIEGGWRTTHEDLSANPPFFAHGGQINDLSWRNHGTAVMGEIMGSDNGFGITGIAPGVQWGYSSIAGQSTSNALLNAGAQLDSGDIILIELHAPGPHYDFESRDDQLGYVMMEFWQDNFNAIEQLSIDGIIVCEAAGNGGEDFDDIDLYGNMFDTTVRNSQAIVCGAGGPADGNDRHRLGFSNYGERVNLQGYGSGVITTGYGGYFSGASEDQWYTSGFSGTSSASPIVTGSVAALQGAYKSSYGITLDADAVRTVLNTTGSPQQGDTSRHIGPRPNLRAAIDEVLGVSFFADSGFGQAPLPIQFNGLSAKTVNTWIWDFGDGDSSFLQSPEHTYQIGGLYDVSFAVESVEGDFHTTRVGYIAVAADTILGSGGAGAPGAQVRVDVYVRNSLSTRYIAIPIEWAGPLDMSLDSASSAGLRSSGLLLNLSTFDPFGDRALYTLSAPSGSTDSYLPAGSGPVLSVWFGIDPGTAGGVNPVIFDGFATKLPNVITDWGSYAPTTQATEITLCNLPGDADGSGALTIGDVTYLVTYIFNQGPPPSPLGRGDTDCSGSVTIADVTLLVNHIFNSGELICNCAP